MSHQSANSSQLRLVTPPADDAPTRQPLAKGKPRPKLFRALGRAEPPVEVEIGQVRYELLEVLKHDSWAATAIYRSAEEKIVCKFNRQQSIGLLPMKWLGRRLASRENYLLRRLADLPTVPDFRGPILVNGLPSDNVAAHVFIEGHPLRKGDRLADHFFPELQHTLEAMHERGIAYVDLHKAENILVGDDRRSYLIDFQVCYIRPRQGLVARLLMRVERALQQMDFYHFRKHQCVHRPDLAGYTYREWKQRRQRNQRPWWLNVHRAVAVPLRTVRRRLLVLLGIRKGKGHATSEHFAEDAIRQQLDQPENATSPVEHRRAA